MRWDRGIPLIIFIIFLAVTTGCITEQSKMSDNSIGEQPENNSPPNNISIPNIFLPARTRWQHTYSRGDLAALDENPGKTFAILLYYKSVNEYLITNVTVVDGKYIPFLQDWDIVNQFEFESATKKIGSIYIPITPPLYSTHDLVTLNANPNVTYVVMNYSNGTYRFTNVVLSDGKFEILYLQDQGTRWQDRFENITQKIGVYEGNELAGSPLQILTPSSTISPPKYVKGDLVALNMNPNATYVVTLNLSHSKDPTYLITNVGLTGGKYVILTMDDMGSIEQSTLENVTQKIGVYEGDELRWYCGPGCAMTSSGGD